LELFELAAKQKHDYAAYQLGKLYLNETEIKDVQKGIYWLTTSSVLGNQYAQYALAKLYQEEKVIPADISKAVELYVLSAKQGNEFASYQLGKLYLSGTAVPKDVQKAIEWLTVSAEKGNQFAQYVLGKLFFYDADVSQDKEKSLYWLGLSAAQGNIYAQYLIDNINRDMSPSVLLAGTRLIQGIGRIFREDDEKRTGTGSMKIDRKRRRQLQEKKQALGHAGDDYEQMNQQT